MRYKFLTIKTREMEERKLTFNELPDAIALLLVKMERLETHIQSQNNADVKEDDSKDETFLTRKETALFFNISLYTIHDWMRKGIIKPYKAGNRTYFKKAELIEVLNNSNSQ